MTSWGLGWFWGRIIVTKVLETNLDNFLKEPSHDSQMVSGCVLSWPIYWENPRRGTESITIDHQGFIHHLLIGMILQAPEFSGILTFFPLNLGLSEGRVHHYLMLNHHFLMNMALFWVIPLLSDTPHIHSALAKSFLNSYFLMVRVKFH